MCVHFLSVLKDKGMTEWTDVQHVWMHSGEHVTFQLVSSSSGRWDGFRDEATCSESLQHLLVAEGPPSFIEGGRPGANRCFQVWEELLFMESQNDCWIVKCFLINHFRDTGSKLVKLDLILLTVLLLHINAILNVFDHSVLLWTKNSPEILNLWLSPVSNTFHFLPAACFLNSFNNQMVERVSNCLSDKVYICCTHI